MLGRKTITPPTPPITPSSSRSLNGPSGICVPRNSESQLTPSSIQPMGYAPIWNVAQNISHITSRNSGKPKSLLVTNESMILVVLRSSFSYCTNVSFNAPCMKPYFSEAITELTSSPRLSPTALRCSSARRIISSPWSAVPTVLRTSGSPSISLIAMKRGEAWGESERSAFIASMTGRRACSTSGRILTWMWRTSGCRSSYTSIIESSRSFTPLPVEAVVGTTGTPSILPSIS